MTRQPHQLTEYLLQLYDMALLYAPSAASASPSACANPSLVGCFRLAQAKPSRAPSVVHSSVVRAQQSEPPPPPERFDVSSNCVQPVFRSVPANRQTFPSDDKAKILFLSESNVCRSVYAEAMLTSLIKEKGLQDVLQCSSKGTRDYNVGEQPSGRVVEVAEDLGLDIKNHIARVFDCANDVVEYDLLLVMDKFTASDALKDVTIYEAIDKHNSYSWKVRRLGEFCLERKIEDIDDPLYGNIGGSEELEELYRVALDIRESCDGLMNFLTEVCSNVQESENLKQAIARSMGYMAPMEWLVPPMLQRS